MLGFVAALLGRRHGWVAVLAILVMTWVAASLTVWWGVHVIGPDHAIDFVALFNGTTQQRVEMLEGLQAQVTSCVSTVALSDADRAARVADGRDGRRLAGASMWPT